MSYAYSLVCSPIQKQVLSNIRQNNTCQKIGNLFYCVLEANKNIINPMYNMANSKEEYGKTVQVISLNETSILTTPYEQAVETLGIEVRGFTKEEAELFENAMKIKYKPVGVNIRDLC